MRINFYDTRVEDYRTVLVKEKAVNYVCEKDKTLSPAFTAKLMISVTSLNEMGEEHAYMIALNNQAKILGIFFISKGTVNQTLVNGREIFMRALLIGASFIILCHNHPMSGNPKPSRMDIEVTEKIKELGELLGVPVADHIIIGADGYFSFMEQGLLEQERSSL